MKNSTITDFKIRRINLHTGGKIADHQIPDYEPAFEGDEGILRNSFVTRDGQYIGEFSTGWWYYRNGFKVCPDKPLGVAIKYQGEDVIGYMGYTHRGGCLFSIGDRLFTDAPAEKTHYTPEQWAAFEQEYERYINRERIDRRLSKSQAVRENPITDIIPFKLRGSKVIETLDEAKQAAINFSEYLS